MNQNTIKTVGVIGLGTMGHGIAQNFATGGYPVRCYDQDAKARQTALSRIRSNLEQFADAGYGDRKSHHEILERITVYATEAEAVGPADFVTEAVAEDLTVKQQLFERLEAHVASDTILASNSSSFPITRTAINMQSPERAVLTHWFNPPHLVPVVEVVPGERTSDQTTVTSQQILRGIGKKAIRINKEIPGFLVNRVQIAMYREVWDLFDRGIASAEEIDEAIRGSMGMRLAAVGPLQISDFAGLDIHTRTYESIIQHMRADEAVPGKIGQLVEQGHYGVKTGQGIFDYTPELIEEKSAQRDQGYLRVLKMFHGDE